jgi:cobalt-zinc-cadmium efflux system protein
MGRLRVSHTEESNHCEHKDEHCAPHEPGKNENNAARAGAHSHGHSHGGGRQESRSKLIIVLALTSALMVVELIAGYTSHSLALMADAGHMLSDVASQALALLAIWFASKPPTTDKTYGYYRTEILAGLVNGVALVIISIVILYEAASRIAHPPEVHGSTMLVVAAIGVVVNLISMRILTNVADHSLNVKAAYLELLGDLLASIGVLLAAIVVAVTHWYAADPLISMLIGILILPRTWMLLAECTNILMEGTPQHIDADGLRVALLKVNGVIDVHDMHVWTITSGLDAMSGHVCVQRAAAPDEVLAEVTRIAQKDFGIQHTTIQVELVDKP